MPEAMKPRGERRWRSGMGAESICGKAKGKRQRAKGEFRISDCGLQFAAMLPASACEGFDRHVLERDVAFPDAVEVDGCAGDLGAAAEGEVEGLGGWAAGEDEVAGG